MGSSLLIPSDSWRRLEAAAHLPCVQCLAEPEMAQPHGTTDLHLEITFFYFKKDFSYLFLEKGEGREKERERNIHVWLPLMRPLLGTWPATQACALTGNRTGERLVRRPMRHPLSPTSQGWKAHSKGRSSYVEDLLLRYIPPHLLPKQRRRLGKGCFG